MDDPITPVELARELGHVEQRPGKMVRDFLRARYGDQHEHYSRWQLTPQQANEVRAHFRGMLTPSEVRDMLAIADVATVDELVEKLRDYLNAEGS
ncbi:hypothetical protein [Microbacterium album]|uniref:Uncharacterized protein n=1 Tax=Microbacterium album TaxID=2053191 RepID=A0A917IFP3_9MICO|nr:hypothetical protein [Microbacterium album]GGH44923.1 hypothetical protein GCM10010921_19950 [Microbacterium album]